MIFNINNLFYEFQIILGENLWNSEKKVILTKNRLYPLLSYWIISLSLFNRTMPETTYNQSLSVAKHSVSLGGNSNSLSTWCACIMLREMPKNGHFSWPKISIEFQSNKLLLMAPEVFFCLYLTVLILLVNIWRALIRQRTQKKLKPPWRSSVRCWPIRISKLFSENQCKGCCSLWKRLGEKNAGGGELLPRKLCGKVGEESEETHWLQFYQTGLAQW